MTEIVDVSRIRTLNDGLRRSLAGGVLMMTAGVIADNDPHGERDFGTLQVEGERLFFKIDYYDRSLTGHSPDPADPSVTTRVLTIMLSDEV